MVIQTAQRRLAYLQRLCCIFNDLVQNIGGEVGRYRTKGDHGFFQHAGFEFFLAKDQSFQVFHTCRIFQDCQLIERRLQHTRLQLR